MKKRIVVLLLAMMMAVICTGALADVRVGQTIYFGSWEQDNNLNNGTERIGWYVLDVKNGKALVISMYGLINKQFTEHSNRQTWSNSTLRSYLNNDFYYGAFSSSERRAIQLTHVDESASQQDPSLRGNRTGPDTDDYIFIPSYAEIIRYLPSAWDRLCSPTDYVYNHGGNHSGYSGYSVCWYWLRNPVYNNNAGAVDYDGSISSCYMNHTYGVVRPCCWVDASQLGY